MTKRKGGATKSSKPLFDYFKTKKRNTHKDYVEPEQIERARQRIFSEERAAAAVAASRSRVDPIDTFSTQESAFPPAIEEEVEQLSFQGALGNSNLLDDDLYPPPLVPTEEPEEEEEGGGGGAIYFDDVSFFPPPLLSQQQELVEETVQTPIHNTQQSNFSEFTEEEQTQVDMSDVETSIHEEQEEIINSQFENIAAHEEISSFQKDTQEDILPFIDSSPLIEEEYPFVEAQEDDLPMIGNAGVSAESFLIGQRIALIPTALREDIEEEEQDNLPMTDNQGLTAESFIFKRSNVPPPTEDENEEAFMDEIEMPAAISMPVLPEFRRTDKKMKENRSVVFKPSGLAARALRLVQEEQSKYVKWETKFNHTLELHERSIVKACNSSNEEVFLFRMIKVWMERGLIFAWCVQLNQSEIDIMMLQPPPPPPQSTPPLSKDGNSSSKNGSSNSNSNNSSFDKYDTSSVFKSPPTINTLPPYVENEAVEKILFAFSFSYHTNSSNIFQLKEEFMKRNRVVAIWPPWDPIYVRLKEEEEEEIEVNLVTRFRADGL